MSSNVKLYYDYCENSFSSLRLNCTQNNLKVKVIGHQLMEKGRTVSGDSAVLSNQFLNEAKAQSCAIEAVEGQSRAN